MSGLEVNCSTWNKSVHKKIPLKWKKWVLWWWYWKPNQQPSGIDIPLDKVIDTHREKQTRFILVLKLWTRRMWRQLIFIMSSLLLLLFKNLHDKHEDKDISQWSKIELQWISMSLPPPLSLSTIYDEMIYLSI